MYIYILNTSVNSLHMKFNVSATVNNMDRIVCALAECTSTVFCIWPDDGSIEPKHVAEFLILVTVYIVVLLTGINDYTKHT